MTLNQSKKLCYAMALMCIMGILLIGCGGATNSLMDEDRLANEGWVQYQLDNDVYERYDEDGKGFIESAYREGFHIGFNDVFSCDIIFLSQDEVQAYEIGYADGVWNRTGDY